MIRHLRARRPTKSCPHWLCPPLHRLLGVESLIFIILVLMNGLAAVLFLVLASVISLGVMALVYGKSPLDAIIEEQLAEHVDTIPVVRRGWARTAAACDILACCNAASVEVVQVWNPDAPMIPAGVSMSMSDVAVPLCLAVGFIALTLYAHRAATRPGRTQRALAFARGEN